MLVYSCSRTKHTLWKTDQNDQSLTCTAMPDIRMNMSALFSNIALNKAVEVDIYSVLQVLCFAALIENKAVEISSVLQVLCFAALSKNKAVWKCDQCCKCFEYPQNEQVTNLCCHEFKMFYSTCCCHCTEFN